MAAKFEIRSPKAGRYAWVLVSQGRTLATSEPYSRRALAEKAIVAFRMAAVNAPVIDTTMPAAQTTSGKAARAAGRALAKTIVTSGRAVEKAEKTAAKATRRARKTVAAATTTKAQTSTKKTTAPRKRASRAR
ncbi:MAG: YegP family protein [Acidimicrobiia bacterium]